MDILLNELSLKGQFRSVKQFIQENLTELVKFLKYADNKKYLIMKKHDFYASKVTQDGKTIHNIFISDVAREYDSFKRLKIILVNLLDAPYWEDNPLHLDKNVYCYNNKNINNTSLAESCERDKIVVSFMHNDFKGKKLIVKKDNKNISVDNILNLYLFLDLLKDKNKILFEEYINKKFENTKLDFSKIENKFGFKLLQKEDESLFLDDFNRFSMLSWDEILRDRGFDYKEYKDKNIFRETSFKIDKFRITQKYRCFGYRDQETFFVLRFELDHKLSDKG